MNFIIECLMYYDIYLLFLVSRSVAKLQDKQSFWNDVSEDKLWETKKQKMLDSQPEYCIRPQKQKYIYFIKGFS